MSEDMFIIKFQVYNSVNDLNTLGKDLDQRTGQNKIIVYNNKINKWTLLDPRENKVERKDLGVR